MPGVWLDTDIGGDVDDAVALLCAARHPEIDLVGVSTVMHRVEINAWLAREMVTRAALGDVPVLPGAVSPLAGGDGPGDWLPSHGRLAPELPRVFPAEDAERTEAIADAMMSVPAPYHLVTIGPLTNIARLLRDRAGVRERWLATTCMGGWLEGDPEYNIKADVRASRLVLEHLKPRLVGLEAAAYSLTREEAEAALDPTDPASAFLLDCYQEYRLHADWHGDPEHAPLTLFDSITLLSLVRPDAFGFQPIRVDLEDDGSLHRTDGGMPVTYALSADWDALKPLVTGLLSSGDMPG